MENLTLYIFLIAVCLTWILYHRIITQCVRKIGEFLFMIAIGFMLRYENRRRTPPGPLGLPLVGYLPFLTMKPYLEFKRLTYKYGNVFSLRLGSYYAVVLNDYESTCNAFAGDACIGRLPDSHFPLDDITVESGAFKPYPGLLHRILSLHLFRELGFEKRMMEAHAQEDIQELLHHFEQLEGKATDLRPCLASSMTNNIASFMFGQRFRYSDPFLVMMTKTLNESSRKAEQTSLKPFFPLFEPILKLFIGSRGIADINKELKEYIFKEIRRHEETLDPENVRDFIDGYLLEIAKRKDDRTFCKEVLQDLVLALFLAGSERVRVTIEWLLLTVAAFPDAQRRVKSEIDEVLHGNNLPTYSDHKKMPYTNAVICEVMRWRTAVPISDLRFTISSTFVNCLYIPNDTLILVNLWAIHHDRKRWGPDADEFKPERFLSADGKTLKIPEYFIPFSVGTRTCPGELLAKTEIFLYFVAILQRFEISMPEDKEVDLDCESSGILLPKVQALVLKKRQMGFHCS